MSLRIAHHTFECGCRLTWDYDARDVEGRREKRRQIIETHRNHCASFARQWERIQKNLKRRGLC